jgi:hypothetical protein
MTTKDIILELAYCINLNRKPEKELLENTIGLIKHLQAENEGYCEIIKKQDDEISDLRKDLLSRKNLEESFSKSVKQFDKKLAKTVELTKAEAYKECIEKVKDTALVIKENAFQGCYVISKGNLDNLLKEKVGEGQ